MHRTAIGAVVCLAFGWLPQDAGAQPASRANGRHPAGQKAPAQVAIDGPAAPDAPAVVNRDDKGRATVRAVRLSEPLLLDGKLSEEVYETVRSAGDFIQQTPREGAPATEKTEVWIFFDDRNLYISARCHDTHPEREVVNEMRRDHNNISQNESIAVVLDTFYDRRSGFFFQTTPLGAIRDQAVVDEQSNESWNTIWEARGARFEQGWTMEMAIPFKSLRYRGSGPQVWGINFRRIVKWKNEISYLSAVPAAYSLNAVSRMNVAGTLVGLETPGQSMNLEIKPYALSSVTTDKAAAVPYSDRFARNAGFDFKYGLTRSLTLDATVNTDFAQVEEDLQQVNLTRFSLFFPEKREFFLEGQGIMSFGGAALDRVGASGGEIPVLFFSRQIGLSEGQTVPVVAGARVTGKAGAYSLAALNMQTDAKPSASAAATNFSVLRIKRDILRRSSFGIMMTNRLPTVGGAGSNQVAGLDASFGFFDNLKATGYVARTRTTGLGGKDTSYRARFDYAADRYGLGLEHIMLGQNFNPEVGYVWRHDFRRSHAEARFSPRPKTSRVVRKLTWQGSMDYITNADRTVVENKAATGSFGIEFHNGDTSDIEYRSDYEFVPGNFTISPGVVVPPGGYRYQSVGASYNLGRQRRLSGSIATATGSFYGGRKTEASYRGRLVPTPRFSLEPSISLAQVSLPYGDFTVQVISNRTIVTPTPRMLISSLVQYTAGTHSLNTSVRFRWEYRSGSEFFAVYTDGRDTAVRGLPTIRNRSIALKITRLVRF